MSHIKEMYDKINSEIGPDVLLLAVTKTFPIEVIKEGLNYGITQVGENKVQELIEKYNVIGNNVKWHFIGHLQRNKVKYIIGIVDLIHSVDSIKLAEEINKRAGAVGKVQKILLEVNVSGEKSKNGIEKNQVIDFIKEIKIFENIKIEGLMTMAPLSEDKEMIRSVFKNLRIIRDEINTLEILKNKVKELSMGMSGDYKIAVSEGSTIVRVGSLIYGNREYNNK